MAWHYLCIELHSYITCVLIYIFQSGRAEKQKNEKQEKQRSRKRLKTRENRKRKKRRSRKTDKHAKRKRKKQKQWNRKAEKREQQKSRNQKKILNLVKKYINNHPYINRFTHSSTAGLTAPPPGLKEFALQVGRPMRDSTLPCRGTWMFIPIQELLGNHSDEGVC